MLRKRAGPGFAAAPERIKAMTRKKTAAHTLNTIAEATIPTIGCHPRLPARVRTTTRSVATVKLTPRGNFAFSDTSSGIADTWNLFRDRECILLTEL